MENTRVLFEVIDLGEALVVQIKHVVEMGSRVVLLEITLCQLLQELLSDYTIVLGIWLEVHSSFYYKKEVLNWFKCTSHDVKNQGLKIKEKKEGRVGKKMWNNNHLINNEFADLKKTGCVFNAPQRAVRPSYTSPASDIRSENREGDQAAITSQLPHPPCYSKYLSCQTPQCPTHPTRATSLLPRTHNFRQSSCLHQVQLQPHSQKDGDQEGDWGHRQVRDRAAEGGIEL